MGRATRADVARAAGVSLSAVSHVMNGRAEELGFAPATARRVKQAAFDLGYVPRAAARAFRYSSSHAVALFQGEIPDDLHLPIASELLLSAVDAATKRDAYLVPVLCNRAEHAIDTARAAAQTIELAGAICEYVPHTVEVGKFLLKQEIPVVWMNPRGGVERTDGSAALGISEGTGVAEVLAAIDMSGSPRVTAIQGPGALPERIAALQQHVKTRVVTAAAWTAQAGMECAAKLFAAANPTTPTIPDIVFAANDHLAFGILAALVRAGIAVPDQVQVIGYGDFDRASTPYPELTTIHWPLPELAASAVAQALAPGAHRQEVILPTSARLRATTRPAR